MLGKYGISSSPDVEKQVLGCVQHFFAQVAGVVFKGMAKDMKVTAAAEPQFKGSLRYPNEFKFTWNEKVYRGVSFVAGHELYDDQNEKLHPKFVKFCVIVFRNLN